MKASLFEQGLFERGSALAQHNEEPRPYGRHSAVTTEDFLKSTSENQWVLFRISSGSGGS
jgi:hypothetical protein